MLAHRRSIVARSSFVAVLAVGVCLSNCNAADSPTNGRTRIVLIGHAPDHPFGSHMYLFECRLLAKCLEETPGVEAVVSDRWPRNPRVLDGVRAIVFYSSPAANLMLQGPHAAQARDLLRQGVGYTAIHWATGAKGRELGEEYLDVLGGWFDTSFAGLDVSPSRVRQLDRKHPICRGWHDFDLRDEWYLRTRLNPRAKSLLAVRVKGADQVVAWTFERPHAAGGRSFGTTLGHFHEDFAMEPFRRLVVNGILWTAHREIPSDGAAVLVTRKDLDLGPAPRKKPGR